VIAGVFVEAPARRRVQQCGLKMILKFFYPLTKITISFFVSLILGIIVVFVQSTADNIAEKKEIRQKIYTQIQQTVHAYQTSHRDAGPDEIAQFITRYARQVLPEEVITVPPAYQGSPQLDGKPLWSTLATSGEVKIYLNPAYMALETTGADIGEITDGILAALLIFFALWVYVTKNEQAKLERLLHDEERRRLTTALHEQEAYALLGHMTTTLSHELRTPVATLTNLVETFPKRIGDQRFAERFIQISHQELERMRRLIDNLLIYGKELSLEHATWVDLKQVVRDNAQRHDLNVSVDDIKCSGDKFYLDILFANLMRNSAEAGANAARVRLHKPEGDKRAVIDYQDDGRGFLPDIELKSLLSPFVTTRSKGAGLGLDLANKIVRAHGGELELYRPAAGAGFRIWLPASVVSSHP
jgi:signal transduction histidine kinase